MNATPGLYDKVLPHTLHESKNAPPPRRYTEVGEFHRREPLRWSRGPLKTLSRYP